MNTKRHISRREFIRVGLVGGSSLALGIACSKKSNDTTPVHKPDGVGDTDSADASAAPGALLSSVGLQLYTVRDLLAGDLPGTLRAVSEIGYDKVEFAGYFDHSPAEIKGYLADADLTAPVAHTSLEELQNSREAVIDAAAAVGHQRIVLAWLPPEQRTGEGYLEIAGLLNETAAVAAPFGIRVGYHNHDFDFLPIEDRDGLDILMAETDAALVDFELDIYWAALAGRDIYGLLEDYPGRFRLCHLKDLGDENEMLDVGAGTLDWPALINRLTAGGCELFFVEHDNPSDPMASISNSYRFLS